MKVEEATGKWPAGESAECVLAGGKMEIRECSVVVGVVCAEIGANGREACK